MKPRVVYWNTIPSPYLVERFNAVADRGSLQIEVWFNERTVASRSWEIDESAWRFNYRYLPGVTVRGRRFTFPVPVLRSELPEVLVSLYAQPSFLLGSTIARSRGARTAFWSQVTHDTWVPRRRWKEALKRFAFPRVDATLGNGQESRSFAMRYGTAPEQAMTLPHVIDSGYFRRGRERALPDREALRQELGLRGVTFVYVGRLWWGKGLGYLLDAYGSLPQRTPADVSLLLVGDGPDLDELQQQCERSRLSNVVFAGFQQKSELPRFLAASDVFVFPTLGDPYGLVVDEAMASSLPVISTSAAGEISERIDEGIHGIIVPPADAGALADAMERLALDDELRTRMGEAGEQRMRDSTPERWAIDFERVIFTILESPQHRRL